MKQFFYRVRDPNGLHARPAGQLTAQAKRFSCAVQVEANGKSVDAKRLLALMSLGATHGTMLKFTLCGEDEEFAATALEVYLRSLTSPDEGGSAHEP